MKGKPFPPTAAISGGTSARDGGVHSCSAAEPNEVDETRVDGRDRSQAVVELLDHPL